MSNQTTLTFSDSYFFEASALTDTFFQEHHCLFDASFNIFKTQKNTKLLAQIINDRVGDS